MEKYSHDKRTLNEDKGKLFGSAAKALGVGIKFLLDSWLQKTGAWGKTKDWCARATKGHSSKEGV